MEKRSALARKPKTQIHGSKNGKQLRKLACGGASNKEKKKQKKKSNDDHLREICHGRNAAADCLAKERTDLDGGAMATIKVATVRQERMDIHSALQYCATFHGQVANWHDCDEPEPTPVDNFFSKKIHEQGKHQVEWCASSKTYRCMRCAERSVNMKIFGACRGPKCMGMEFNPTLRK